MYGNSDSDLERTAEDDFSLWTQLQSYDEK